MLTMATNVDNNIPIYHPFDDSFINDPNSMKFRFACREDVTETTLIVLVMLWKPCMDRRSLTPRRRHDLRVKYENTTNPVRERTIPRSKNKKYPTKPKNNSKIQKMKAKSDKFDLL